jgi:hypothetical protein
MFFGEILRRPDYLLAPWFPDGSYRGKICCSRVQATQHDLRNPLPFYGLAAVEPMGPGRSEVGTRTVLIERLDRLARDRMVQEIIIEDFKRKGRISSAWPNLTSAHRRSVRWSCQRIEESSLRQRFTRRENTFRQVVGSLRFSHDCHFVEITGLPPVEINKH